MNQQEDENHWSTILDLISNGLEFVLEIVGWLGE